MIRHDTIVLGTAKFGLQYGLGPQIFNGNVESQELLDSAEEMGIRFVDTSPSYGDAESTLNGHPLFQIVTKVAKLKVSEITVRDIDRLEQTLSRSFDLTGQDKFYGLLIHQPSDLLLPGANLLVDWMHSLVKAGKVKKIGVSVYTVDEAHDLYSKYSFNLIQIPLSIFNQSFRSSGALVSLANKGVEIHARSLFLKGALLKSSLKAICVPEELRVMHNEFVEHVRLKGCSLLDACKIFAEQQPLVDKWVVGVASTTQLSAIIAPTHYIESGFDFSIWANINPLLVDPRNWGYER
jgi:aryl-alcohol dehydrogenase-like predicted oxidoreductase